MRSILGSIGVGALTLLVAAAIKGGEKKSTTKGDGFYPPAVPGFPGIPTPSIPGVPTPSIPGVPTPSTPSVPGLPQNPSAGDCLLDAALPAEIAGVVNTLLRTVVVPADLRRGATMCDAAGFPLAAGCLRARAAQIEKLSPPGIPPIPGFPVPPISTPTGGPYMYTIRAGDFPSGLAAWFTRDGLRWRELGDANPDLLPAETKPSPITGVPTTNYRGWRVGKVIEIPESWNPWTAAPPPVYSARAVTKKPAGRAAA